MIVLLETNTTKFINSLKKAAIIPEYPWCEVYFIKDNNSNIKLVHLDKIKYLLPLLEKNNFRKLKGYYSYNYLEKKLYKVDCKERLNIDINKLIKQN